MTDERIESSNPENEALEELPQQDIDEPESLEQNQLPEDENNNITATEQDNKLQNESGIEPTAESVVEAVLFASDESLAPARLAEIVGTSVKQLRNYIDSLNEKYKANNNAFRIETIAGGYQMLTLNVYNHWLLKLVRVQDEQKLTPAALETLAIIAYKQPVIRADIEAIRGVAAGEVLRGLIYKGLVKIVGRAEVLGRPMLYGTTKKFLKTFGLNTLKDLPNVEELKKPQV